jgi:hypothetical protein
MRNGSWLQNNFAGADMIAAVKVELPDLETCSHLKRRKFMAHKPPPVPPAEQSPKSGIQRPQAGQQKSKAETVPDNLKEQDQQGNIYQNTHNQGYQQDR